MLFGGYCYARTKNIHIKRIVYRKYFISYSSEKDRFIQNKIFSDSQGNPDIKDIYEKNLWFCKKYFKIKVSILENIDSVISTLEHNLSFNVQIMTTDFDAQSIFETLNNRGKPLTILEKLKNRLIYLDSKKSDGKLRNEINTV